MFINFMPMNRALALLAVAVIVAASWRLLAAGAGTLRTTVDLDGIPATIFRPATGGSHPVVVIAHGFAGSQQLMQSFALTFARNGYIAVTFDFPGHGRNAAPLTGSISDVNGATRVLVACLARVAAQARGLGDGRLAVLGHSMASDIVIRFAQTTPNVAATIAVSMFSPTVTATSPANLLVIVGDWEGMLKREALRAVGLFTAPSPARDGVTYGDPAAGTARRAAFSAHVEHASVLFSQDSMREALAWLDRCFGTVRATPPLIDGRGPWILLLIGGVLLLGRALATLLPRMADPPAGAGRNWRRLALPLLVPMIATPLLLRILPTHFLPVLVGDYLAAHFALYGIITWLCLLITRSKPAGPTTTVAPVTLFATCIAVIAFGFVGIFWPIDTFVTSFAPGPQRIVLILAMLAGTLAFFVSDEWLTRGQGAARGAYAASKLCFLVSLALAVALDPYRLFFLVIIVPVIVLFFIIYGIQSRWIYRRTGLPLIAGIANAVAFAWAIGCTFPLLSG